MITEAVLALAAACAPVAAPETMAAIVSVESGGNPHAIGRAITRGKERFELARQPANAAEAAAWATWLQQHGYRFDAGIAQVNSQHFARYGIEARDALNPCLSVAIGADILAREYVAAARVEGAGQGALISALSSYNTGHRRRGIANGYVARVERAALRNAAAKRAAAKPTFPRLEQPL